VLFLPNALITQFQLLLKLHLYDTRLGYILMVGVGVGVGPLLFELGHDPAMWSAFSTTTTGPAAAGSAAGRPESDQRSSAAGPAALRGLLSPDCVPAHRVPSVVQALKDAGAGHEDIRQLLGYVGRKRRIDSTDVIRSLRTAGLDREADAFTDGSGWHRPAFLGS
jgi:hypothetical protein